MSRGGNDRSLHTYNGPIRMYWILIRRCCRNHSRIITVYEKGTWFVDPIGLPCSVPDKSLQASPWKTLEWADIHSWYGISLQEWTHKLKMTISSVCDLRKHFGVTFTNSPLRELEITFAPNPLLTVLQKNLTLKKHLSFISCVRTQSM